MLSFTSDQSEISLLSLVAPTSKVQHFSLHDHTDVTTAKPDGGWNEQILPVFTAWIWQHTEVL